MSLPHSEGRPPKHVMLLASKKIIICCWLPLHYTDFNIDAPKFAYTLHTSIVPQFQGEDFASFSAMDTARQKHK